ncbi:MAG TPA: hypothetical protein VEC14_06665 [Reyranellaceae bacterium]|nr:hypothetical protein [Reyranellaceae bacterium]
MLNLRQLVKDIEGLKKDVTDLRAAIADFKAMLKDRPKPAAPAPVVKRRGRPKGSKNKPKTILVDPRPILSGETLLHGTIAVDA